MSRFFVNRPIVAMVISIITVVGGLLAMRSLPVAQYPRIIPPQIIVSTTFTGADALAVEQSVATPLEQAMNGVDDMLYMQSTNANDGTMQLTVTFDIDTDPNIDQVNVSNRVAQAQPNLPTDVNQFGLAYRKSTGLPMLIIALYSPHQHYDSLFLANYANINVNDALYRVRGVGEVRLFGASDYAMRVWLKPDVLAKLGLTVPDLVKALSQQSTVNPAGRVGADPAPPGKEMTYTVRAQGRLQSAEEFAQIVVRSNPDGSVVRLSDVARIELGALNYQQVSRVNGQPGSIIAVFQAPGSNALDVARGVKSAMAELKQRFPPDLDYLVTLDSAVPVSLIGTFAVFPLLGFSINTLSLFGLVLAIGLVVDDAIVVVEAVEHHIDEGMSPKEASLKAMEEVWGPVVAIAIILSAVFLPTVFIPGITGRLYQQFAITIAISVLFSAVNALTLSPALASLLLKPKSGKRSFLQPFYDGFNKVFGRFTDGYLSLTGILVRKALRSTLLVLIVGGFAVLIAKRIPGGFLPDEDNGYIFASIQLPDASSLERTDAVSKRVEAIIGQAPGVEYVTTVTGFSLVSGAFASNTAFLFVSLKLWEDRKARELHAFAIMAALNRQLAKEVQEGFAVTFGPPPIIGLGSGSGFTMMLQDRSGGTPEFLAQNAEQFLSAARKRPEIGAARTVYRANVPQIFADIDRDKVTKLGIPVTDVNATLGALLGGAYVNDFNRFGRTYRVYLQAEPQYRADVKSLGLFSVKTAEGNDVPLDTLLSTRPTAGPEFTNRFNLYRAAEITGHPAPGYSSAQALTALEETAKQVLPQGMGYAWSNVSYQEKKAEGTAGVVFAFAILLVFLVLAAQYESWSLPMSVMLGTPFAAFGAFLGLYLARLSSPAYVSNVFAQIGLVMLVGLAAKNAILIVEFAKEAHERDGLGIIEAAMSAAKLRLRPILMTAFAFILGVLPLVRAAGAGAEGRKVMGMTVFSGMLVATILGVILVPVLFVAVGRLSGAKAEGAARPPPHAELEPEEEPRLAGGPA